MTGAEVKKDFLNRVDKSYSRFQDDVKLGRIFTRALSSLIESRWMGLATQKEYDELRHQITTEKKFSVKNNKINISPLIISSITNSGAVVTVTTIGDHNLDSGDIVAISGVQGVSTVPVISGDIAVVGIPSSNTIEFPVSAVLTMAYVANSGVLTHKRLIQDYLHLFAMKCKFLLPTDLKIKRSSVGNPPWIEFNKRTSLRDGDKVVISGYSDTNVNGERYLKHITDSRYGLYIDENLLIQIPAVNGSTLSGGKVSIEFYNYGEPTTSDQKIGEFQKGTVEIPKYETADSFIKIYPSSRECKEVTVDYLSSPKVSIDFNDNTTDLTLIWPYHFIDRWISKSVELYSISARDQLLSVMNEKEAQKNK